MKWRLGEPRSKPVEPPYACSRERWSPFIFEQSNQSSLTVLVGRQPGDQGGGDLGAALGKGRDSLARLSLRRASSQKPRRPPRSRGHQCLARAAGGSGFDHRPIAAPGNRSSRIGKRNPEPASSADKRCRSMFHVKQSGGPARSLMPGWRTSAPEISGHVHRSAQNSGRLAGMPTRRGYRSSQGSTFRST